MEHPSRYLDHEWGACEEQDGPFHLCMVYADAYEVGQPNMGLAILYNAINAQEGMSCERAYLPWKDMSALMRQRGVPMLSLEGAAPLASFDAIGFTLAHELIWTNILEALDLAGIALDASERDEDDAIVLAGGPSAWNCEPLAPALDAVLLGRRRAAHRSTSARASATPASGASAAPSSSCSSRAFPASTCPPSTGSSMTRAPRAGAAPFRERGRALRPWSPRRASPTSLPRRP